MDPERAIAEGVSLRLWDCLFYASFAFVVTSSASIAGVLLVSCYLIVPSVAAMLYAEGIGRRPAIGWSMGTVVSVLGMYFSVQFDLPTVRRSSARSAWSWVRTLQTLQNPPEPLK